MVETLLYIVIYLIVIGLVVGLLLWAIREAGTLIPAPFAQIARILVIVIAIIVIIFLLLGLLHGGAGVQLPR